MKVKVDLWRVEFSANWSSKKSFPKPRVLDLSTVRLDELCRVGGLLFCGGPDRWEADSGGELGPPFPLLVTAGCSLSREPSRVIGSPSRRDEPLGYVAADEQNRS